MNRLFQRIYLFPIIGLSWVVSLGVVSNAIADPVSTKECQPVARDLESQKTYCAHELRALKLKHRATNQSSRILCYLVRQVLPIKALFDLSKCVPPESGYQVDNDGGPISPKPKGSKTSLAILRPLGNTLVTSQPDLAWNSIPKAASYRVSLERGGQWVWSQETGKTELKLPSAHALQQGGAYKLSVVAFSRDDQVVDEALKSLRLVGTTTLTEIDNAVSASVKGSPDRLVSGLDRAAMLHHAGLLDAAVSQLEVLAMEQEPAVYQQLSIIYRELGQDEMAQKYSKKALDLAQRKK
jgi:hypothetical protein